MTAPPPPVEKLLAFYGDFSAAERAELEVWLQRAERDVETVKAALRSQAAADVLGSVGDVPGFRRVGGPGEPQSTKSHRAALRIARAIDSAGGTATVGWVMAATKQSRDNVQSVLRYSWFRDGGGPAVPAVYSLTEAGRAALAEAGAACAG